MGMPLMVPRPRLVASVPTVARLCLVATAIPRCVWTFRPSTRRLKCLWEDTCPRHPAHCPVLLLGPSLHSWGLA